MLTPRVPIFPFMRVLVVDDEEQVRAFATRVLERAGHIVQACENGTSLMALAKAHPPDVIVTDIFMPEVDGYQLLRMLGAECPNVPVVVISGGSAVVAGDHLVVARMLKASAVLQKPFTGAMLLEAVALAAAAA
jgi:two-component system nitrogen regulation response regulator GlnG